MGHPHQQQQRITLCVGLTALLVAQLVLASTGFSAPAPGEGRGRDARAWVSRRGSSTQPARGVRRGRGQRGATQGTTAASQPASRPQGRAQEEPKWVKEPITGKYLEHKTFRSATIQEDVSYLIYLPPSYKENQDKRYPVMYWLHGKGGNQTGIPRFCDRITKGIEEGKCLEMIVVFVNGLPLGGYMDSVDGKWPVESVTIKDLIPHIDATYRTIPTRSGRLVEGFSMGGSGAAKWGMKYPEIFSSIGVFAGALHDAESMAQRGGDDYITSRYGSEENFEKNNVWTLVEKTAVQLRGNTVIRITVGANDGLATANTKFHETLQKLNIEHRFRVIDGAAHSHPPLYDGLGDENWEFYREAFAKASEMTE